MEALSVGMYVRTEKGIANKIDELIDEINKLKEEK